MTFHKKERVMDAKEVVGIKSATLSAAREFISQAFDANQAVNSQVNELRGKATKELDKFEQELQGIEETRQRVIGSANRAAAEKRKAVEEKIEACKKTLNAGLVELEAKNPPILQSEGVQKTLRTADKGARGILKMVGKAANYVKNGLAEAGK